MNAQPASPAGVWLFIPQTALDQPSPYDQPLPRRAPPKPEPTTHILTRTELKANREAAKQAAQRLAAHPERTLMPWGEFTGKPMEEVPGPALVKAMQYYLAAKRSQLKRSREIVRALQAALDTRKAQFEADPLTMLTADDDADGLPFTDTPTISPEQT